VQQLLLQLHEHVARPGRPSVTTAKQLLHLMLLLHHYDLQLPQRRRLSPGRSCPSTAADATAMLHLLQ
jgi:hypothetical protein